MIQTSQAYRESVYAPIRQTTARVTFDISDVTAASDNAVTVTSEAEISRKDQLTDQMWLRPAYATFEPDYWRLDGSIAIPPKASEPGYETGWYSGGMSGEAGLFTPNQVMDFSFSEDHSSMGITISFDLPTNEWAEEFDIDVYDRTGVVIRHVEARGNEQARYVVEDQFANYRRIRITLRKWCKPNRRAKVIEVSFGVIRVYKDDKLVKANMVEELNALADVVPANEIKFTVDNSSKEFNILNPKGFYAFLQEQQVVAAEIGVYTADNVVEWINMGIYYLTDWQSDEGALTTTFTARNVFNLLDKGDYMSSGVTWTLYGLAENVLQRAGIEKYSIDNRLRNIPTSGFPGKVSYRKALQLIGIAAKAVVYQDRTGVINIKVLEQVSPIDNVTSDNMYKDPQIKLDKLVSSVDITTSVYSAGNEQEVLSTSMTIIGTYDIFVDYTSSIFGDPDIVVSENAQFVLLESYPAGAKLRLTANGTVTIRITGTLLVTAKTTYNLRDELLDGGTIKVDNPLINNPEQAHSVGLWLLNEYKMRALYTVNWRQNPALECGDIIQIEDSFKGQKQSRISKQEFEYVGYLQGKTEAKGGH
ncbi:hypothetical protein MH117_05095 [Paenibacillus sp. ACRRX]|uniref:hypothetical protein n=1 Tax=Paenibacillus sp. ACRRX TaxID=2918206 RepID=UPI001EF51DB7|nr:hypothetical protein [Paenibacillus sp. ACRRX]MCG7406787.1 hypothetical protein [Paenibacillus sp. ACRRX]